MLGKIGAIVPAQNFNSNLQQYRATDASSRVERNTPDPNPAGGSPLAGSALPSSLKLGLGEQIDISA